MELVLNTTGNAEFPVFQRLLVAGQPGVGKTHWASTLPKPLFANAGGGLTTLAHKGRFPYVEINGLADLFAIKTALDRLPSARSELFGFEVDTLVLDTFDEMQRRILNERLRKEHRTETKMEDWGWLADKFHAICEGLAQLDVHVIYITHTKDVTLRNGDVVFKPGLAGQFAEAIHNYVDASLLMRAATPEPTVNAVTVESEDDEVVVHPVVTQTVDRWFNTTPQIEAEWVHDKTGLLPSYCDPADLFSLLLERPQDLVQSSNRVISLDSPPDTSGEIPGQITIDEALTSEPVEEFSCQACGASFTEKAWYDLSRMKYNATYCGDCYKKQNNKGKANGTNSNVKLNA